MTRTLILMLVSIAVAWMALANWPSVQLPSLYKHDFINRCTVSQGLYQEALFNQSNNVAGKVPLDCEILNPINIALILQIFFGSFAAHFYIGSYTWCIVEMIFGLVGVLLSKNMTGSISRVVPFLSLVIYILHVYYFALNAFHYNQEMKNMDIRTLNRSQTNFELRFL